MATSELRDETVAFRLNREEAQALDRLVQRERVSRSGVLRKLLWQADRQTNEINDAREVGRQ